MFKKLSIFLLVLLFCSNAFAFCLFGLGDCGGKNFFIIDKNTTYIDQNITIGSVGGFYFPGLNLTLNDANFFAVDLNGFMNQSSFDSNVNSVIASIMPISDSNLSLPSVWAAIDGNAGSGSGAFYFPGASLTLDDDNFFHVNDANLNANLDFVNYNCDDNSDCALTGNVNSTTGEFVNLTVTGTSTIEEDLSVIGDFNAGITGSYPLIYKKAGGFSLFGSTVSGTASMGVGVLSIADGPYATAIGFEAEADGTSTIAMNNKSYAKGNYAMAFGNYASADGTDAVAIGLNADANISGGPGGCVAIGYEAECRDLGMVTLSKDVTIARDLEIGNCVTLNDKIICDWGDVNGTVPDLNGYMTELTFDSNITALDLNNSLDYLSSSTYIPTEEDIDANALAVINSLDLNNSLDYLVSGTYIPSENSIDANINEIIASRMPITDANLSIPNVWSAIDGNKSINTSCDNNADCTITGDVSGASGLPDGDVSWSVLNGIVPWVDANVADDITLTNITQITNRAFADITGKPIYYPYATPIGDANIDSASAWNAKLDWTQVNTVVPWVDENISNDLTVNGYVTDAVFNASTPIADGNISSATTWNNKLDWSQVSALFPVADENQTKTGDWTGTLDGYEASELLLDTNAQNGCTANQLLAGVNGCTSTPTLDGTNFTGIPSASVLAGSFGAGGYTIIQGMSDYTTAFTSPHLNIGTNNAVDNTGFVGITYDASTSANYGWSAGALRDTGGQSTFVWKYHLNSAEGTERMRLDGSGNLTLSGTVDGISISSYIDQDVTSASSPTLDGTNFTGIPSAGVTDNVSASAVITDHTLVRGHGGAKIVQDSGIVIDDSDNVSGMGTLGVGAITSSAVATINTAQSVAPYTNALQIGAGHTTDSQGNAIFFPTSTLAGYGARIAGRRSADGAGKNDLVFLTGTNAPTERLAILDNGSFNFNSGNVSSMGTLEVGAITSSGIIKSYLSSGSAFAWGYAGYHNGGIRVNVSGTEANNYVAFDVTNDLAQASAKEVIRLKGDGKVGVGTPTPLYGLIEVKPTANNANTGITIWTGTGLTCRSWIDSDDDWQMTRGATAGNGIVLSNEGYLGVGKTPIRPLDVEDDYVGEIARFFNNGNNVNRFGIGIQMGTDDASGTNYPLLIYDGSGDLEGGITLTAGTVAIYDVSDETKKQNIVDSNTNNILQNFKDLRVVDFEFKKIPNVTHTSFLAQDINNYFPEAYVYKPERTYIEKTLRVIETGLEITYKETELIKATYLVESEGEITEEVSELIDGKEIINEVTRKVSVFTDSRTEKIYYNPSDWFEEYYEEFEKTIVEPEFIGTSKSAMIPQLALGLKEIITVDENQSTEIQELQNQVTILQNELCKKDITYAWCEPIGKIS